MSSALAIATHLNAPYGPVLDESLVARSLKTGSLDGLGPKEAAILGGMFTECDPQLIAACVSECGASLKSANDLYHEIVSTGGFRRKEWEDQIGEYL